MTEPRDAGERSTPDAGSGEEAGGPVERLRRRDELLQVLFWLEGEGFEAEMHAAGVKRFLQWPEERIERGLEELVADGFAVRVGGAGSRSGAGSVAGAADADEGPAAAGPVRLTEQGRMEGGRRFVSEFASILSRETHHGGECHDPNCDCHELGPAACTAYPPERE